MTRLYVDSTFVDQVKSLTQSAEICDASGQVIGYFRPKEEESPYRTVEIPFTNEEVEQFLQEPGGRSLQEILRDLRAGS